MVQETIETILEVMITLSNGKSLSIEQEKIAEHSCLESGQVVGPLNMLVELGLLIKTRENGKNKYSLIKKPRAIHLAKVAQIGVNLNSFSNFFQIDEAEKALALSLAANSEKMRTMDVSKRKSLIQKRAYYNNNKSDEVSENLMILLEVSNNTLYEYLEQLADNDPALKLLMDMHSQAEQACHNYIEGIK